MNKKMIWWVAGGIAAALFLVWALATRGTPAATAVMEKGDLKKYVAEVGTVQCRDWKTVMLEGGGVIQGPLVEVGERVKRGDLLLRMEKTPLEIDLKVAGEQIGEIQANLQALETAYETALSDLQNTEILAGAGAASKWELAQKEAALKNAEAVRDACQTKLEQAVLQREAIRFRLGKQEVLAPADGVVLERNVEAGMVGAPGSVAYVIGDTANMEIEANILADDVYDIEPGDEVEITTRADAQRAIRGRVARIAPGAATVTSSLGVNQKKVAVTIVPLQQEASLKPGYEVDVRVITQRKEGVLRAPVSAVFDYQGKSCVFLVQEGRAVLRPVQTGLQDEYFIEIVDGLQDGEVILSGPDNSIREGMRIRPE